MITPDDGKYPRCPHPGCDHPWHGLPCSWSSCRCPHSLPITHETKESRR